MNTELTEALQADVTKVLEEHMPSYVCGVVKERLEQADEMEAKLKKLEEENECFRRRIEQLLPLEVQADELKKKQHEVDAARQTLYEERDKFETEKTIFELQTKLQASGEIIEHTREVNLNLTRNLTYRKNFFGDVVTPVDGGNGCSGHADRQTINQDTTETVE